MTRADLWHRSVVALLVVGLAAPVLATLLYSFSTRWGATVLPEALTLDWYRQLWGESRFLWAFLRTLLLCLGTLVLVSLIVVPTAFLIIYRMPQLDRLMGVLILLPFTVPPVVSSVGLLQLYADEPLALVGTPWILAGCYFMVALPFVYRSLSSRLSALALHDLMDAAHLLGASTPRAFVSVVLPNLSKAWLASMLVSLSFLLGEFVFANLLVGSQFETLQIYLYNVRQTSGHFTSAIVMSYFVLTLLLTWIALWLNHKAEK